MTTIMSRDNYRFYAAQRCPGMNTAECQADTNGDEGSVTGFIDGPGLDLREVRGGIGHISMPEEHMQKILDD